MNPESPSGRRKPFYAIGAPALLFFATALLVVSEVSLPHQRASGMKRVVIAQGMGSRAIATLLKEQGIIRSQWAFVIYVSLRGEASSLKPGAYEFPRTAAIPAIARDLVSGASREREITIPEGWNIADIAAYFEKEGIASEKDTIQFLSSPPPQIVKILDAVRGGTGRSELEGYLFPDTYRVYADAPLIDIAAKMLENFGREITSDMRAAIARQGKTIPDVVMIASMIEKEVSREEDRSIVSGILWKRLELGIPLQVDATILYITGKKSAGVSREDLAVDSPYNTYRYPGLPQGPIANPGISSLRAAIWAQKTPYLYYLSAPPDGRTIFSRTLDEHNAAKTKYLKNR